MARSGRKEKVRYRAEEEKFRTLVSQVSLGWKSFHSLSSLGRLAPQAEIHLFLKRTFLVLQNEVSADFRVRLEGVSQQDGEWPSRGSTRDKGSLTYSGTNGRPVSLK
jgi:hypothetical protein